MHATSGSGNNFRLKSDSGGIFTIRDHSAGADRLLSEIMVILVLETTILHKN